MIEKKSLKELLATENLLVPCVYDCASARAVELCGYKAMMLSGAEMCMASKGMPDLGLLTLEDLIWTVSRITNVSPLPLAVDIEDGYGGPINVYHTCQRLAKAGASAVLLEDEIGPGFAKGVVADNLLSREAYYEKVKAGVEALKGTDCIFIARTNVDTKNNLEEGIQRCLGSLEAGADMTVIVRLNNLEDAKVVSERVPGWKMFPDLGQDLNAPELDVEDIYNLGFNFVTMHYLIKAAMAGMMEYGLENFKNNNNVYSNKKAPCGVVGHSGMPFFAPQKWLNFEAEFTGRPAVKYHGPSIDKEFDK